MSEDPRLVEERLVVPGAGLFRLARMLDQELLARLGEGAGIEILQGGSFAHLR
jgi:hypothetical protein